jgi:hypothetical protein
MRRMTNGWPLVLSSALIAFACTKDRKEPAPSPESGASSRASVGRLPVTLQPGPFGLDCSLNAEAGTPSLTRSHKRIEARKLAPSKLLEIPLLGARVPFLDNEFDEPPFVYVTPSELRDVQTSAAEWAHVYATIAESALPFDACVAHIGQESFTEPVTFTSLTIRIYTLEEELDRVMREASVGAIRGATRVACETQHSALSIPSGNKPFDTTSDSVGAWRRFAVDLHVWYGDYGGVAHVELRGHRRPGATVVVVAFYALEQGRTRDVEVERFTKALE